jgi:hypothetical protein
MIHRNPTRSRTPLTAALILAMAASAIAERNYLAWGVRHNPAVNASQFGVAVATDRRGNVAATGYDSSGAFEAYYTAKYDALTGALLWQRTFASAAGHSRPASVVCDSSGNVIVTGRSVGAGTSFDYYTIKYAAANGNVVWEKRYNNANNGLDEAIQVVVDGSDHVIVTGKSVGSGTNDDIHTIKYDGANGDVLWERRHSTNFPDRPEGLAVAANGDIAVTGSSRVGTNLCYYTAKYSSATGTVIWDRTFDGAGDRDDTGKAVAFDPAGNVLVTGTVINADVSYSFHTIKYASANGNLLWQRTFNSPGGGTNDVIGIRSDAAGNAIIAGTSRLNGFKVTFYVAKYSAAAGAIVWEKRSNRPGFTDNDMKFVDDIAVGLAVDAAGNAIVHGWSENTNATPDDDIYTVKFDGADGTQLWEQRLNGDRDGGNDFGRGVAVDLAGNVAIVGTARKPAPSAFSQMVTVKYNRFLLTVGDRARGDGLSDGAVISSLNPAAVSDNGGIAARVGVRDGKKKFSAILSQFAGGGNVLAALQGQSATGVSGAVFQSFSDPVVAPNGRHAFIARLGGVPSSQAASVWTNVFSGTLECALQAGKDVPGLGAGVQMKSATSISLRNGYLAALITLQGGGVNKGNSTALVGLSTPTTGFELMRTGRTVMVDGQESTVQKLSVYVPAKESPGHGRYHATGRVVFIATLADKRTVLYTATSAGALTPLLVSGGDAGNVAAGAEWKSFGVPVVGTGGLHHATLAHLAPKKGGVTAGNDTAIVASNNGSAFDDIAVEGGDAFGITGGTFTGFSDPVSNDQGRYAFIGTFKGAGVKSTNRTALWFGTPGALVPIARTGSPAADENGFQSETVYASIGNFALPGGAGAFPLFMAKLKGPGVNAKNNTGLWSVDSDGFVRQLLRTGGGMGEFTIRRFVLLNSVPGAFSANRSFNGAGGVTAMVTFTDKTQALVLIGIP